MNMKKEYIVPALMLHTIEAEAEMLIIVSGGQGEKGAEGDVKPIAPENSEAEYGNLW